VSATGGTSVPPLPEGYRLRELHNDDYDTVFALWQRCEGIGLNESDSRASISAFLARNAGLSSVVTDAAETIVGSVLCGHDGRRGYLHHLTVAVPHRRKGLGRILVDTSLGRLRKLGIVKCNIFLYATNVEGRKFWLRHGWAAREDLVIVQRTLVS
jgi:ribosomal protein S18 acetylase RimI-like enzyme